MLLVSTSPILFFLVPIHPFPSSLSDLGSRFVRFRPPPHAPIAPPVSVLPTPLGTRPVGWRGGWAWIPFPFPRALPSGSIGDRVRVPIPPCPIGTRKDGEEKGRGEASFVWSFRSWIGWGTVVVRKGILHPPPIDGWVGWDRILAFPFPSPVVRNPWERGGSLSNPRGRME